MNSARSDGTTPPGRVGFAAPRRIRLIPLEPERPDPGFTAWLASALEAELGSRVTVEPPLEPEPGWWEGEGSQLHSGAIVDTLVRHFPDSALPDACAWVLGVTAADLRGGERDFVFGEATVGGSWAVIGLARFGAEGEPAYRRRALVEALHELGHAAGLAHCADRTCLMAASVRVEDIDRKEHHLCARCRARVGRGGT